MLKQKKHLKIWVGLGLIIIIAAIVLIGTDNGANLTGSLKNITGTTSNEQNDYQSKESDSLNKPEIQDDEASMLLCNNRKLYTYESDSVMQMQDFYIYPTGEAITQAPSFDTFVALYNGLNVNTDCPIRISSRVGTGTIAITCNSINKHYQSSPEIYTIYCYDGSNKLTQRVEYNTATNKVDNYIDINSNNVGVYYDDLADRVIFSLQEK